MSEGAFAPGTLYVVATPIGNLADLTFRAVEVLRACPVVAVEDTRSFRVLAQRYELRPRRLVRCDEHREARATVELVDALLAGDDVALTSDAGTPGISDPGHRIVREAVARGVRVVPIPGASAPLAALSASGLPTDRFLFAGFPPRRAERRRAFLRPLLARPETLLLLESPNRVAALMADLVALAPTREVVLARELTKVHEELARGTAAALLEQLEDGTGRVRGELVLVVAGAAEDQGGDEETARLERARELLSRPWIGRLSGRDVADLLAVACSLERNAAYELAQASRGGKGGAPAIQRAAGSEELDSSVAERPTVRRPEAE